MDGEKVTDQGFQKKVKKKSRISEEGIKNQGFQKEVKNQGFQKKG